MFKENQSVSPPFLITTLLLSSLAITVTGCAPERPETLIRDSSREGSPSVIVVSDQVTTRREIQNEIDALPFWLQTRFNTPTGESIFARDILIRELLFRKAIKDGYGTQQGSYERYEKNLITWFLHSRAQFPQPQETDRIAYLKTKEGEKNFDKRDVYVIYVASKSLADKLYDNFLKTPVEGRLKAFQEAVDTYSQNYNLLNNKPKDLLSNLGENENKGTAFLTSLTQVEYDKQRKKATFSYLEDPRFQKGITINPTEVIYGTLGPFDLSSPPWTITKPTRDAYLWKIYLLGDITSGVQQFKDGDLSSGNIDEKIFAERQKEIVKKIMQGETIDTEKVDVKKSVGNG